MPWPKTVFATNAIIIIIIKDKSSSAHDKSLGLGGLRKTICITVQTDLLLIKSFSSRSSFTTTTASLSATQHQFRPCCAGPQCLISFVPEYAGRPQHWNRLLGDSQSLHGYIPFINCRFIFLRQHRIIRVIRGLPVHPGMHESRPISMNSPLPLPQHSNYALNVSPVKQADWCSSSPVLSLPFHSHPPPPSNLERW